MLTEDTKFWLRAQLAIASINALGIFHRFVVGFVTKLFFLFKNLLIRTASLSSLHSSSRPFLMLVLYVMEVFHDVNSVSIWSMNETFYSVYITW